MRKCLVKLEGIGVTVPATFHMWTYEQWVVNPSPAIGGHSGGQMSTTLGIVEFEDGTCSLAVPTNITFIKEEIQNGITEEAVMG